MLEVLVPDMACGHCSNAAAVRAAIAGAGYTVS